MINLNNFDSNLLKITKKSYKDIDIYYIRYHNKKKLMSMKIFSVNPLYLTTHSATGHLIEKNDDKYLVLDSIDIYEEIWSGIRWEIKILNGGKELFYEKNCAKIGIKTGDYLPLNKPLKFPTLTIVVRCVF